MIERWSTVAIIIVVLSTTFGTMGCMYKSSAMLSISIIINCIILILYIIYIIYHIIHENDDKEDSDD